MKTVKCKGKQTGISVLLLLALLLSSCGKATPNADPDWRSKGNYSYDYPITPTAVFCVRLNAEKTAYEVYSSADGSRVGTLDFAAHASSPLYYGADGEDGRNSLEFFDHDGDGYQDFGVAMEEGVILWYAYAFGSSGSDRFRYVGKEEAELVIPTSGQSDSSSATSSAVEAS